MQAYRYRTKRERQRGQQHTQETDHKILRVAPKLSIIAVEARLPISLVGPWPTFYGGILPLEICGNFAACLAGPGLGRYLILDAGRWRSGAAAPAIIGISQDLAPAS